MENAIELIKKEHLEIEQDLEELETIMSVETINYPNLIHTCNACFNLVEKHEEKEEKIFKILKDGGYNIPLAGLTKEHQKLEKYRKDIRKALHSGSEFEVKKILEKDGKEMISLLRAHMKYEDEFVYTLPLEQLPKLTVEKLDHFKG
jgi:hypothetical protein